MQNQVLDNLISSYDDKRLAQCYLFYGQFDPDILKSAFALAVHVLCKNKNNEFGFERDLTEKYINQRTHPNFFILESSENGILVEDTRSMNLFLQSTPTMRGWRFIIINTADDLNMSSSNAILKNIEEIPEKTTVVMISYCLAKVRQTLISRSQKIFFKSESNNVAEYVKCNEWCETLEVFITNLVKGIDDPKIRMAVWDCLNSDPEKQAIFQDIVLFNLHKLACGNHNTFCANLYEEILDFVGDSDKKALPFINVFNTITLKLQNF